MFPSVSAGSRNLLALLTTAATLLWIGLPTRIDIIGPRLGIPAIVVPGEEVDIRLRTSWPVWQPDWQVSLRNGDHSYALKVNGGRSLMPLHNLRAEVPAELPPGKYSLAVRAGGGARTVPGAVHVLADHPESFSLIHIADLPIFGEPDGLGEAQMAELINEIALINPDLVVAGGDVAYGASWANYQTLYDFLNRLEMPVVVAPGNHEYEAWNGYLAFFRQRYHSVEFGNWRVISIDSGHRRDQPTYSQMRWLAGELERIDKPTLINIHHPLFGERGLMVNVPELMSLLQAHDVPLVLSGHNHGDRLFDRDGQRRLDTNDLPPPLNIVTTSAGARIYPKQSDSPLHHGYRLIRIKGDRISNFTYDYDGDGLRDVQSSIPVGRLIARYPAPNEALISNGLNESFSALRLRIPGGGEGLIPDAGELIRVERHDNELIYVVDVPIAANSNVRVQLQSGQPS